MYQFKLEEIMKRLALLLAALLMLATPLITLADCEYYGVLGDEWTTLIDKEYEDGADYYATILRQTSSAIGEGETLIELDFFPDYATIIFYFADVLETALEKGDDEIINRYIINMADVFFSIQSDCFIETDDSNYEEEVE